MPILQKAFGMFLNRENTELYEYVSTEPRLKDF